MRVPEDFPAAFAGLEDLVWRIAVGEVGEEDLVGRANAWGREDCGGSATLAKAALLAMRYELGKKSLLDAQNAGLRARVGALDRVNRVIDPPGGAEGAPTTLVPVKLPEALRRSIPGAAGFLMDRAQIMAAAGRDGWHLSFSHPNRYPDWQELLTARTVLGELGDGTPEMWASVPAPGSEPSGFLVHLFERPPTEGPARGRGGSGNAGEGRRPGA